MPLPMSCITSLSCITALSLSLFLSLWLGVNNSIINIQEAVEIVYKVVNHIHYIFGRKGCRLDKRIFCSNSWTGFRAYSSTFSLQSWICPIKMNNWFTTVINNGIIYNSATVCFRGSFLRDSFLYLIKGAQI